GEATAACPAYVVVPGARLTAPARQGSRATPPSPPLQGGEALLRTRWRSVARNKYTPLEAAAPWRSRSTRHQPSLALPREDETALASRARRNKTTPALADRKRRGREGESAYFHAVRFIAPPGPERSR